MEKDLEWYLKRLPKEIEFPWVAMYGTPYTYKEEKEEKVGDPVVHWSSGKYPYCLRISKNEDDKWVAHYVLEGYDGDYVCVMPECDLLSDRMIEENNDWLRFEEDICARADFKEVIVNLWNWLVSKNLVSDE